MCVLNQKTDRSLTDIHHIHTANRQILYIKAQYANSYRAFLLAYVQQIYG